MRFVVRKFVKEVNLLFVGGVHAAMIEDREKGQTGAGVSFRQIFGRGLQAAGVGFGMVLLVLLLIPAINMSGITQSRMRKRMAEIGVRKAFGATRSELLTQVLYENLLQTLLGGVLGLFFSYASVLLLSDWLLDTGTASMGIGRTFVNAEMMFNPVIFLYAFLACLALNLLSAGIPAWRASRMRIISALNENVH